ncbi:MAG TPA: complex I NDUFA9 subunit family protein [Tepidisphaeraceae bacterium]|jgi:NADH dehydrogenase|nr:complex I NDUFA9 subunit family protein [Tepidisphaeraceae bacterium]
MAERVFVTGASGFVGSAVMRELVGRSFGVNALVRGEKPPQNPGDIRIIRGDLFDAAALDEGMRGCAAVIHLVGIIMENPQKGVTFQRIHVEGTRSVLDLAHRIGVQRYIQMSALGTRANASSEYHKTKWQAEELVRASGLDWTIIRPSMIHGPDGEFMKMEAKWARKRSPPFLFMPYFGAGMFGLGGAGRLQPVYVNDVARAFVDAIANSKTIGKTYELGGSEQLTWPQMHKAIARAIVGKNRLTMPIPVWYAKMLAAIVPGTLLPFNRDQVTMSQEDNTCDLTEFQNEFGWKPAPFEQALSEYARTM